MAYDPGPRQPGDKEETDIVMCVVPKPDDPVNVLRAEDGRREPLLVGTGHDTFLCGSCRTVLAGNMGPEEMPEAPLFECYVCGAYNRVP